MGLFKLRMSVALAACLSGTALPAQPARVPASSVERPTGPVTGHPYISALAAVSNYQSCGANARRATVVEMDRALHAIEAAARSKGLGPTMDRLYRDYQAMLAVSTMVACVHGPRPALADARQALEAFRLWVTPQPRRP